MGRKPKDQKGNVLITDIEKRTSNIRSFKAEKPSKEHIDKMIKDAKKKAYRSEIGKGKI